MRTLSALILALGLVACGGGSKPAAQEPAEETSSDDENLPDDSDMPVENEQCCCQQGETYEVMSVGACEEAGAMCNEEEGACAE